MDKINISPSEFKKKLEELKGKVLWSVLGGESTGCSISLSFGKMVLRERPISNERLTREQQLYDGEIGALVSCGWRVQKGCHIVCGSGDSYEEGGVMLKGVETIIGKVVQSINWTPFWDMEIEFNDDVLLKLFCDITEDGRENYVFFFDKMNLAYYIEGGNCYQEVED